MSCSSLTRILTSLLVLTLTAQAKPHVYNERNDVTYQGSASDAAEHFLNIKFAQDTSGSRRFAPPQHFDPPQGSTIDASSPGPACPQLQDAVPPAFDQVNEISEDCLNLRISRPLGTQAHDNLPVVVWLHGGGIVRGSAYDSHFDPERLIQLSASSGQPIIFVAIQHRLNIFGFASLDALVEDHSTNAGMRDQRAAFEWLKKNIAAFGGDPDRITAYGHSSGGTFISLQHFAFGGEQGLPFDQAWMMSGPPGTALNISGQATRSHTRTVAKRLGCTSSDDRRILSCLRDAPMAELLRVAMDHAAAKHPPLGLFTFLPTVDDDFLPDRPSVLLRQGKFVKGVPSILGWTQDDRAMNAGPAPMINSEADMEGPLRNFAYSLSQDQMAKLHSLYPASDFEEDVAYYDARKTAEDPPVSAYFFALSRMLRDVLFTCSSFDFTYQVTRHTRNDPAHKSRFNNVRLYDFNQSALNPLWNMVGMPWMGVSHGSDINYIFDGHFPEGEMTQEDQDLADKFSGSLISFAYTGDPSGNAAKTPIFGAWPEAYDSIDSDEQDLMPSNFNLLVVGGPYGTHTASMRNGSFAYASASHFDGLEDSEDNDIGSAAGISFGKLQEAIFNPLRFGAMTPPASTPIDLKIGHEKLLQRCAYINSIAETLDN